MNYPNIRVSAGVGSDAYYETPEDYAARSSWDRFKADGSVHTPGIDHVRIQDV
jgi:hypothetical protein